MKKSSKAKPTKLTKIEDIQFDKIRVFFKRSILKAIMKILTMEHAGFRTFKSMKNINRLFSNIDEGLYSKSQELASYIWCIQFFSKQWLDGIVDVDLIIEGAKRQEDFDNIKDDIITSCVEDKIIISPPEAKMIFDLIGETLQYGFLNSLKEEFVNLLDDIDLDHPGAFRMLAERLFLISQSLIDIKHNTNMVANKVTFNTADLESMKEAVSQTISSLSTSNNVFKVGIRRLNTLLSPGYMNGRIYVYLGLPASFKSGLLLKSALDIRKYNPDYQTKTPGMKPCVLYITMENTFTETIERIWNMTFDDSIADHNVEEAVKMLSEELGISYVINDGVKVTDSKTGESELTDLLVKPAETSNIEVVMKYFPYRSISTDDIFTLIQDLRDENLEVCAISFDYIKRIKPSIPVPDNEKLELNRIINELKAISVIADIPVITAHQMNRAAASTVDNATRQGKGDVTKLVGRENVGSAWEILETADWAAVLNLEYKPGTDDKYLVVSVVKRRRIDSQENDMSKYTYLAHPFHKKNGLRLIDDMDQEKVLSLQSLVTDLDIVGKEKTNAVPRINKLDPQSKFVEFDDDYYDKD